MTCFFSDKSPDKLPYGHFHRTDGWIHHTRELLLFVTYVFTFQLYHCSHSRVIIVHTLVTLVT